MLNPAAQGNRDARLSKQRLVFQSSFDSLQTIALHVLCTAGFYKKQMTSDQGIVLNPGFVRLLTASP